MAIWRELNTLIGEDIKDTDDRSPLNAQDLIDAGEDSDDDPPSTMYGGGRGRRR